MMSQKGLLPTGILLGSGCPALAGQWPEAVSLGAELAGKHIWYVVKLTTLLTALKIISQLSAKVQVVSQNHTRSLLVLSLLSAGLLEVFA